MNSSIELIALHNLSNIDLTPGNVIDQLPIANPDYCPNQRAYVVRDKDTAYRIAVQFGTTPQILREINSLNPDYRIDVTQVICIP
jgi:spore germination protein YaaH